MKTKEQLQKDFLDGTFDFEDALEAMLWEKEIKSQEFWANIKLKSKDGVYYFSPSMIWQCYLKQFFMNKIPKPSTIEALKIFHMGNVIQDHLIADVLIWIFGKRHYEERSVTATIIPMKLYMTGRIDDLLVVKTSIENQYLFVIIEGKSQPFDLLYKTKPNMEHLQQIVSYMVMKGIDMSYLVYINRSGLSTVVDGRSRISKTFKVNTDLQVFSEYCFRAETMMEFMEKDQIPLPEVRADPKRNKECKYCQYTKECNKFVDIMAQVKKDRKWNDVVKLGILK